MTEKRWQRIESVYHAALERRAEERRRFLDEACRNDHTLRDEVESLLSLEPEAAQFLELPDRKSVPVASNETMLSRIRSWFDRKVFSSVTKRHSGSV